MRWSIMACAMLVGCGVNSAQPEQQSMAGLWIGKFVNSDELDKKLIADKARREGKSIDVAARELLDDFEQFRDIAATLRFRLRLRDDGTGWLENPGGDQRTLTWRKSGEKISAEISDGVEVESATFTIRDDGRMSYKFDGSEFLFSKLEQ